MQELLTLFPWIVNFAEFGVLAFIIIRIIHVLDQALARAQGVEAAPQPTMMKPSAPEVAKPTAPPLTPVPDTSSIIDPALMDFVKRQEGFVAKAAWDYKQYTNGYGTKAHSPTEVIDEPTALARLTEEFSKSVALVEAFAPNAPKGVKQALSDLTFNAGAGWEHQGLGTAVKAGDYEKAKELLKQYVHAGGQVLEALVKRREAEIGWFDHPL